MVVLIDTSNNKVLYPENYTYDENNTNLFNLSYVAGEAAGGSGTEEDPYQIATVKQFDKMRVQISNGQTAGVHYMLMRDIELGEDFGMLGNLDYVPSIGGAKTDIKNQKAFGGILDGNNKTIYITTSSTYIENYALFEVVADTEGNLAAVQNLNFVMDVNGNCLDCGAVAATIAGYTTIENITVSGSIKTNKLAGSIVSWYAAGKAVTLKNCVNKASITTTLSTASENYSTIGGIVASVGNTSVGDTEVIFENCVNEGALIHQRPEDGTSFSIIGQMVGQTSGTSNHVITFTNCSFGENAAIKGNDKNNTNYDFEGYDQSTNSNTYTGTANYCKQLIGATRGAKTKLYPIRIRQRLIL